MFNATSNNISHTVVSSTPRHERDSKSQLELAIVQAAVNSSDNPRLYSELLRRLTLPICTGASIGVCDSN